MRLLAGASTQFLRRCVINPISILQTRRKRGKRNRRVPTMWRADYLPAVNIVTLLLRSACPPLCVASGRGRSLYVIPREIAKFSADVNGKYLSEFSISRAISQKRRGAKAIVDGEQESKQWRGKFWRRGGAGGGTWRAGGGLDFKASRTAARFIVYDLCVCTRVYVRARACAFIARIQFHPV